MKRNGHPTYARPGAAAALLLLFAGPLAGQQQSVPNAVQLETEEEVVRQYSVEMIVFEYVGGAAGTTELFAPDPPPPGEALLAEDEFLVEIPPEFTDNRMPQDPEPIEEELPLAMATGNDETGTFETEEPPFVLLPGEVLEEIPTLESAGFVMVEPEEYQLQDSWEKLERLDAYRPLMHTGWIQPTLEKDVTIPLKLRRIGDPPLRLNGTISLYLSRFLHLVVDLSLENKSPQRMSATSQRIQYYGDNRSQASLSFDPEFYTPSVFYRIQEDRIVRNNELRYFDHPKFGVIARITRIEADKPEEMDTTNDLLPGNPIQ